MKAQSKALVSQAEYDGFARSVAEHPDSDLMRASLLDLSTTGGIREEVFTSNLAERIPGVKQSNRAYNVALDYLRIKAWDGYTKGLADNPNVDGSTYRAISELINISTGRGVVPSVL